MKKIATLFSIIAVAAIFTVSPHTCKAEKDVKNKSSGAEVSISEIFNADASVYVIEISPAYLGFEIKENSKRFPIEDFDFEFTFVLNEESGNVLIDYGLWRFHKNSNSIKQFDLVTDPKTSKHLRYSMAHSC